MSKRNGRVVKHNSLIESRYALSTEETRLFLLAIEQIHREDEDLKVYEIAVRDFAEAVGVKISGGLYDRLKATTKGLTERSIEVQDINEDGREYVQWPLLQEAKYKEHDATIRVTLNPKLKPYLLQLRERFTSYQIKNVLRFRSGYSTRIYEMMKQYESIGRLQLSVKELRARLKMGDKYERFTDFRRYVIEKTQKELDKYADITFTYKKIREGRRVTAIEFIIKPNPKNQPEGIQLPESKKKLENERRQRLRKQIDTLDPSTYEEIRSKAIDRLDEASQRSKEISSGLYERTVKAEMINVMMEMGF